MRRFTSLVAGACAFVAMTGLAWAQTEQTPTTLAPTTTTTADNATTSTSRPSTTTTPTTAAGARPTSTTTTSTTGAATRGPVPPPASGASQPLDPTLLGGTILPLGPSTTIFGPETTLASTTTVATDAAALAVSDHGGGPSGTTLGLAAVAWLASLGVLLVYAEDQRSKQWRHLAR